MRIRGFTVRVKVPVSASELRFMGHTLSDNRHGLIASAVVTNADGHAKRESAKVSTAGCP